MDKIQENIKIIDSKIDDLHNQILTLQCQRAYLEFQLKFEAAKFDSIDWLPDDIKNLAIVFPAKYHIVRYSHFPYEEYIVQYDDIKFILCDRVDFDRRDDFKIYHGENFYENLQIPLHLQFYYRQPEKKFSIIHSKNHLYDLTESIDNARRIFGASWHDNMAFGIALYYCWVVTHYIGDVKKYQQLHDVFGGRISN